MVQGCVLLRKCSASMRQRPRSISSSETVLEFPDAVGVIDDEAGWEMCKECKGGWGLGLFGGINMVTFRSI